MTSMRADLQKCGDISTNLVMGKRDFYLCCMFCDCVFLQLDNFMLHMEQQHLSQLCDNVQLQNAAEEHVEITIEDTHYGGDSIVLKQDELGEEEEFVDNAHDADNDEAVELKYSEFIKENKDTANDAQDPLEALALISTKAKRLNCEQISNVPNIEHSDDEHMEEHCADSNEEDAKSIFSSTDDNESDDSEQSEGTLGDTLDSSERQLWSAIIENYKLKRILWDSSEPFSKQRKQRETAVRQITDCINQQLNQQLNCKDISTRIKKLRYKFRSELQQKQLAESRGETYMPSWYYEQLEFLNTSIKHKKRRMRGVKALSSDKSALPLPKLTHAQNLELIDIYKSFPCLWDVQHIGYRFKNQRQEALADMQEAIKQRMGVSYSEDELQKKLYRIRYACTQEKYRKLQCERTNERFKPTCPYHEQIEFLMDNVGPFKCPYCEETFKGADQYKIHKSKHDGSMPFTCPLCQRGFMKVGNCTVHLRRHTRDYPFECKVCKKRYATTTDVNVHMRHHTGEKPYFCEVCGQSFRTWTFFDAHMRRHQKRPSHQCSICAKGFYENSKLTEHMKAHLNVRDQVCNVCGKAFTSSKYLRQHKQIHAEKKKYTCKICGKDFAQYAGLSGHMKSHGTTVSGSVGAGGGCAGGASTNAVASVANDELIIASNRVVFDISIS